MLPKCTLSLLARVGLAGVLLGALAAWPIVVRHDRTLEQSRALAAEFPATVRVSVDGSGVLVGPRWVLTSATVADLISPFAHRVEVGGREYAVDQVHPHAEAQIELFGLPPAVDLVLLRLTERVRGVKPVPLHRKYSGRRLGVVLVGHGERGLVGQALDESRGVAHAVTNEVDVVQDDMLFFTLDRDATELEGVGTLRDSGAPLYVRGETGAALVGIFKGSWGGSSAYEMQAAAMSVPRFAEWIDATMAAGDAGELSGRSYTLGAPTADSDVGKRVLAFFAAVESDDRGALTRFARQHRSKRARKREADASWADLFEPLSGRLAPLEPEFYAERPGRGVALCRLRHEDRWMQVWFVLDADGKLDFVQFGPDPREALVEPADD